ncbi:MAG: hypothetical protein Kow0099_06750 [Candidatus Abyssubacteria bacterium]
MAVIRMSDVEALFQVREEPCVSIYMPTHRVTSEIKQDRTRFKNMVRNAEKQLTEYGLGRPQAKAFIKEMGDLSEDTVFWENQSNGLALFKSADVFKLYRLFYPFEELVHVTNHFHIKPLIPLLVGDGRYYILALSQKAVRLLQATRHSVSEIDVGDEVPESIMEALKYDVREKQLQFHTRAMAPSAASPSGGRRPAIFYEHGVGIDDELDRITEYFQLIDRGLRDFMNEERIPLVIAGVEFLLPIYRKTNKYPYLVGEAVVGNPYRMSPKELQEKTWKVVESHFRKNLEEAAAKYKDLTGTGLNLKDLKEILVESHNGRVESLFLEQGVRKWGGFDAETRTLQLHDEQRPGDEDLLDLACIQTLLHGGAVYSVKPEEMVDDSSIAAVFRY